MDKLPKYIERTGDREVMVRLKGGETVTLGEPRGRKAAKAITAASQSDDSVYALAQALLQHCMVRATGEVAWPDREDGAQAFGDLLEQLYFSDVQRIASAGAALLVPDADEAGN